MIWLQLSHLHVPEVPVRIVLFPVLFILFTSITHPNCLFGPEQRFFSSLPFTLTIAMTGRVCIEGGGRTGIPGPGDDQDDILELDFADTSTLSGINKPVLSTQRRMRQVSTTRSNVLWMYPVKAKSIGFHIGSRKSLEGWLKERLHPKIQGLVMG